MKMMNKERRTNNQTKSSSFIDLNSSWQSIGDLHETNPNRTATQRPGDNCFIRRSCNVWWHVPLRDGQVFALFPFVSFLTMRTSWQSVGLLVTLVQFPLYALIVTLVHGARRKVIVLLIVIAFHVLAGSLTLYD